MATTQNHLALAKSLPTRLQRFFAFNPPRAFAATTPTSVAIPTTPSEATLTSSATTLSTPPTKLSRLRNPFQAHKNPKTSRWHPPLYSLRQQAELTKLARIHGVEELLPFTIKKAEERAKRREEHGLMVKGTGTGQRVKGHEWERTLKGRLEKRRQAMLEMPNLVREWKEVCSLTPLRVLLLMLYSVAMVVVGRSGRNEALQSCY